MSDGPAIVTSTLDDGALYCIELARPKGNVLDSEMVAELQAAILESKSQAAVRAILIEGAGKNFSYGASVEEHRPEQVASMLSGFHGLFRTLIDVATPLLAVVRGNCLGGGLELAAFCHRVFAEPKARLGQPEIALGVFAPVASVVLPVRCGQRVADDLLLSGRTVDGLEGQRLGLVDEVSDDPRAAALDYAREALGSKSTAALRFASRAARHQFHENFLSRIDRLEKLYLEELMTTRDAEEGIAAFLEKRRPAWTNN